jgi:hypothetical protein
VKLAAFIVLLAAVAEAGAAAVASGRHWRLTIDRLECEAPLITVGTQVRYLGPKGAVEAPVIRLVDGAGKPITPRSLVWKRGSKPYAEWLSAGGLANMQSEDVGEFDLRFDVGEAAGPVKLEFGDIRAFALTRGKGSCGGLLKLDTLQAPRVSRSAEAKAAMRIHRGRYPCAGGGTVEAAYPPYLPRQLLLFGRGYLPAAREIDLPMGRAPAQGYAYSGPDDLKAWKTPPGASWQGIFPRSAPAGSSPSTGACSARRAATSSIR